MSTLTWDQIGERTFQTGVDRGVLYLPDGTVVPWNGLTAVEHSSVKESKSFFLDGVKYLETLSPGDFVGKLKAFTYPDEFDPINGVAEVADGLAYYDQPPKSFSMSYRTKVGNDVQGLGRGYKIHILYNLMANPDPHGFETTHEQVSPIIFSWTLNGTPQMVAGFRPTVHVSIDSTKADPAVLQAVENILYGSDVNDPYLPPIDDIKEIFGVLGALIIIDNGDGTWTAIDTADDYITMLDDTTFQIENADADFLDATTYEISTTNP